MAEKTNINNNIKIPSKSFYYKDNFENDWDSQPCAYALDLEIENYFSNLLRFPLDRIIYASNDFTFKERTKKNDGQLNLPYMNYYRIGYSDVDRKWWNNYANAFGLMDIGGKTYYKDTKCLIRLVPIKIEYESTIFFSQQKDCEYAYSRILLENSNETLIYPKLNIKGETEEDDVILKNIAIQNMDLEFNPTYNESDWLVNNKIWTISMDLSYDTFLVYASSEEIYIAKDVLVKFLFSKNLIKSNNESNLENVLDDYFNPKY